MNGRTALPVALLCGAALVTAPARAADPAGTYCGLTAAQSESLTGQTMQGFVSGGPLVAPDSATPVSIRCFVSVNGLQVSSSPTGTGIGAASTQGLVAYEASDGDQVRICTEFSAYAETAVRCDDVTVIVLPGVDGLRSRESGRAHSGGHHSDNGGGTVEPAPPVYPTGTIEITANGTGIVNVSYRGFNPPLAQWSCPTPSGNTATCLPPPAPPGYRNVCGTVAVDSTSYAPGSVRGVSSCTVPPPAQSSSQGPTTTPAHGSESAGAEFPWTCGASPAQSTVWTVTCTVGA